MNNSKSCIDLIFTDQPNLFVDSGVHPTLHEQCHHQIVYGKLSISIVKQPPYTRRIWFYDKSDTVNIKRSIELFNWRKHLGSLQCPNEQVKLLNETLINIYSNFIPNKTKTIRPNEVPWMTRDIKNFLRKRNRIYRNTGKKGHPIKESDSLKKLIVNGATMITVHGSYFKILYLAWSTLFRTTFPITCWTSAEGTKYTIIRSYITILFTLFTVCSFCGKDFCGVRLTSMVT